MNYRGYKLTNYVYYYCVYWYWKDEPQNYHDCYYCVHFAHCYCMHHYECYSDEYMLNDVMKQHLSVYSFQDVQMKHGSLPHGELNSYQSFFSLLHLLNQYYVLFDIHL